MQPGIYEQLITELISNELQKQSENYFIGNQKIEPVDAALYLARFLSSILFNALDSFSNCDDRIQQQIKLCNDLIIWLSEYLKSNELSDNLIETKGLLFTALFSKNNSIESDLQKYVEKITPLTGLSQSELFTGSNAGLSLESELKREILSSDEIWWLVSFVKWTGIRIFREELKEFTRSGRTLKVITTSYMGATDIEAVEFLANLPNTEIKLNYNISQERLHAKSYIFRRNSGFDTGYIGSSNISRSALTSGLEWNLKVTSQEIPHILEKFKSTFETYWASPEFEDYKPGYEEHQTKLKQSIKKARGDFKDEITFFFDIEPHAYQKQILEKLIVERTIHNRWKNLIVAATGTGKTVISAFDFRNFYKQKPDARFLFIAHREEILKQARDKFRAILRESSFGELWVGGSEPEHYRHLFASVQTLNNRLEHMQLTPDYYDYIIIDEVHHIAADSYRPVLSYFSPTILLGLTATPERYDGTDILSDFCNTIAAELRLPDAINKGYLCPFQYFGVEDTVNLDGVKWERGRYLPSELTRIYTANDDRIKHILRNMQDIIGDIGAIKCLGFCVSQDHAEYMTQKFLLRNIRAAVLTSKNRDERVVLREKLVNGEINILFVVDIFNEGIDIPEIDTVLFLRPTESLTIYLQQLGRGLRLADGKQCLTVLDFVGNARPEYNFSSKFRAMVGKGHMSITEEIEQNFPHLPLGCSIVLQKKAKEHILNNIKGAIASGRNLKNWIRSFKNNSSFPLTLKNFLRFNTNVSIEDIYKTKINGAGGWSRLCIQSGVMEDTLDYNVEKAMYKAISNRINQCTSYSYLSFLQKLIDNNFKWNTEDVIENQMAMMVHYDFWQEPGKELGFSSLPDSIKKIGSDQQLVKELRDVIEYLLDRLEIKELKMDIGIPSALRVHSRYSRDQILAAFGEHTFVKRKSSREGVHEIKGLNIELLFVTLQKNEKKFSPTTMYHDFAISEMLFHWQTQNSARPEKGRGLSYINHKKEKKQIILFVREINNNEYGTISFINLGPVEFQSYEGSQPMNITWKLQIPLPSYLWKDSAKLAVG